MQCCDCGNELDDALILVCDHNLCLSCAARKSGSTGAIKCRTCSSVTQLESGSAQQLREMFPQFSSLPPLPTLSLPQRTHQSAYPTEKTLTSSMPLQSLPSPIYGDSRATCGQCDRAKADKRCIQCDEVLCSSCSDSIHRRGKMALHQIIGYGVNPLGGHSQVPNTPMSMTQRSSSMMDRSLITVRTVSCASHLDEPVQYFCLRCETRPMCAECVFRTEDHRGHIQDVVLIRKAFPKIKSRVSDLVSNFDRSIKDVRLQELNLVENKKSIETVCNSAKVQLAKYFSEVRELLRQKEDSLLQQIEFSEDKELRAISSEIFNCSQKRDKLESVSQLLSGSVLNANSDGMSSAEKEIEVLDSFAEMKSIIAEQESSSIKPSLIGTKQLIIPADSVGRMNDQISRLKSIVNSIPGIVPVSSEPSSFSASPMATTASGTPEISSTFSSAVKRKPNSRRLSNNIDSNQDQLLMDAIDTALRAGV